MGLVVALSPRQRFVLCQLLHSPGLQIADREVGKGLRRCARDLGLLPIRAALLKHRDVCRASMRTSDEIRYFEIAESVRDFCLEHVGKVARTPAAEFEVGPFFDDLVERVDRSPMPPELMGPAADEDWTPTDAELVDADLERRGSPG